MVDVFEMVDLHVCCCFVPWFSFGSSRLQFVVRFNFDRTIGDIISIQLNFGFQINRPDDINAAFDSITYGKVNKSKYPAGAFLE